MIDQIVVTVFSVWLFIGLLLTAIGVFIEGCTTHFTNLDTIGFWFLGLWLVAVLIVLVISLMRLIWV